MMWKVTLILKDRSTFNNVERIRNMILDSLAVFGDEWLVAYPALFPRVEKIEVENIQNDPS